MQKMLRVESLVWFLVLMGAYAFFGGSWWLFLGCILVPDVGLVGYLVSSRMGAYFYNAFHLEVGPLLLFVGSYFFAWPLFTQIALIWLVHIHFDRMLGIGLKSVEGFAHTHLGRITK